MHESEANGIRASVAGTLWPSQDRFAFALASALHTVSLPSPSPSPSRVIMSHPIPITEFACAARCWVCPMTIYELVAGLERLHRFHVPCYVQVDIATSQTTGGCVRVGTTQRLLYSAASDHHWLQLNQFHGYIYITWFRRASMFFILRPLILSKVSFWVLVRGISAIFFVVLQRTFARLQADIERSSLARTSLVFAHWFRELSISSDTPWLTYLSS